MGLPGTVEEGTARHRRDDVDQRPGAEDAAHGGIGQTELGTDRLHQRLLDALARGPVVVSAPTGSGKSSTLAALMRLIADTRLVHDAIATWPDLPEPEDGLHRLSSRLDFAPPPAIVLRPRHARGQIRLLHSVGNTPRSMARVE